MIIIVMISITTWAAAMMVETVATVVAVLLTRNIAQFAHALIQMEVGVEQHAHQQQLAQQQASLNKLKKCFHQILKFPPHSYQHYLSVLFVIM